MPSSARALLALLLWCTALPAAAISVAEAEAWPWSRRKTEPAPSQAPDPAADRPRDESADAGAERAALAADRGASVKSPTRPGCYMRMPSGCPKRPMQTQLWRHDTWAEQHGLDEAGCQGRATMWNGFCGSEDAMMAFVVSEARPEALSALQISSEEQWPFRRQETTTMPWDAAGLEALRAARQRALAQQQQPAAAPRAAGGSARAGLRAGLASLIKSTSRHNETREEAVKSPARPGCYMRVPSGCRKMPTQKTHEWRHDSYAEQHGLGEAECQERGAMWNRFCDSQDAQMAFVPQEDPSSESTEQFRAEARRAYLAKRPATV